MFTYMCICVYIHTYIHIYMHHHVSSSLHAIHFSCCDTFNRKVYSFTMIKSVFRSAQLLSLATDAPQHNCNNVPQRL